MYDRKKSRSVKKSAKNLGARKKRAKNQGARERESANAKAQNLRPKKEHESASAKSSAKERKSASAKRKKKRVPSSGYCKMPFIVFFFYPSPYSVFVSLSYINVIHIIYGG
jgi:hypothetical protein